MKLFLTLCLLLMTFHLFAQEEEETEALKAMRLSCQKHKVGLGCYNYANMLIRADKADQAETIFEMGCKLDHSPSCQKEKWSLPAIVKKDLPLPSPTLKKEDESLESDVTNQEIVSSQVFVPSKLSVVSHQNSSSNASIPSEPQPSDAPTEEAIPKTAEDASSAEEGTIGQEEGSTGESESGPLAESKPTDEAPPEASESDSMAPPPI